MGRVEGLHAECVGVQHINLRSNIAKEPALAESAVLIHSALPALGKRVQLRGVALCQALARAVNLNLDIGREGCLGAVADGVALGLLYVCCAAGIHAVAGARGTEVNGVTQAGATKRAAVAGQAASGVDDKVETR